MQDKIIKYISYIFHPILMPLLGVCFYFSKTSRYIPLPVIKGKILSIIILTCLLPIMLFFLLKTVHKVETIHLKNTKERLYPLIINAFIIVLILMRVFPIYELEELYYFFLGILCSNLACLILAILKVKASIHMMAVCGFFMFIIGVGLHFQININGTIAMLFAIIGSVATSRLYLRAHTAREVIIGCIIGFVPQFILLPNWL